VALLQQKMATLLLLLITLAGALRSPSAHRRTPRLRTSFPHRAAASGQADSDKEVTEIVSASMYGTPADVASKALALAARATAAEAAQEEAAAKVVDGASWIVKSRTCR